MARTVRGRAGGGPVNGRKADPTFSSGYQLEKSATPCRGAIAVRRQTGQDRRFHQRLWGAYDPPARAAMHAGIRHLGASYPDYETADGSITEAES